MVKVRCDCCQVSYESVSAMCDHVMGQKHREMLVLMHPDRVKQLGRLQYFVDSHLYNMSILGLQYVLEKVKGSSYLYSCTLCNVQHKWRAMAIHVSDLEHTERYIKKHHIEEITDLTRDNPHLLKQSARKIHDRCGSGKICTKDVGRLCEGFCRFCNRRQIAFWRLCEHVLSKGHRSVLHQHAPEQLKELGSLVHLVQNHMEEHFPLGLEYIVEIKEGSSYNFICQLCGCNSNLNAIVRHIMDVDHMERYIKRHHSDMLSSLPKYSNRSEYTDALRDIAVNIVLKCGRKEIQLKNTAVVDPTKAEPFLKGDSKTSKACEDNECDALSSKHKSENSSHSKRRPLPYPEAGSDKSNESYSSTKLQKKSNIDGLPLAGRGRHFTQGDQDASPSEPHTSKYESSHYNERETQINAMELDYSAMKELDFTAVQHLEFKTNNQFLEYLANFSIDDDEDISFIQMIIQNCIEALTNFKEEEAKKQNSSCPT